MVDDAEAALELNEVFNLAGEGEQRGTDVAVRLDARAGAPLRLSSGGGLRLIHLYESRFVQLENWTAARLWAGAAVQARPWLRLEGRYLLVQDLHAVYGVVGLMHQLYLGADARF